MKKKLRYTYLFIGLSAVVLLAGIISFHFLFRSAGQKLWNSKMESGRRETREIGRLLEGQLQSGLTEQQVIRNLQQSILNMDVQSEFVCMYNTSGVELCHPNPALVGLMIGKGQSGFSVKGQEPVSFSEVLRSGKAEGGIRNFPEQTGRSSEIVNVYPVAGTNWMVASHLNVSVLEEQLDDLYRQFYIVFLLSSIAIIVCGYLLVRWIYRRYEQKMDTEVNELNEKVNTLGILNQQLNTSQEKLQRTLASAPSRSEQEVPRKRLITYQRDELVSLDVNDIALISLEDGDTYFRTFSGARYPAGASLDELAKQLDAQIFYRANRQFIIHIRAIKKILVYGRNQLRLITEPVPEEDIVISKNKVAEFKEWLGS